MLNVHFAMEDEYYRRFGHSLRRVRKAAGLSQEDLAGAIGLTRTSVSNIENGRQKVLLHAFEKILRVLNVQPSDLLPETASGSSKHLMGLDRLREIDEPGLKFVERAGIVQNSKEEHANSSHTDSEEGEAAT